METGLETTTERSEIACRLIGAELAARKAAISAELLDHADAIEELPDGFALHFKNGDPWAERALEFVRLERQCCPFIRFEIMIEPDDGPVVLLMRGNDQVKHFMNSELLGHAT